MDIHACTGAFCRILLWHTWISFYSFSVVKGQRMSAHVTSMTDDSPGPSSPGVLAVRWRRPLCQTTMCSDASYIQGHEEPTVQSVLCLLAAYMCWLRGQHIIGYGSGCPRQVPEERLPKPLPPLASPKKCPRSYRQPRRR